jgi:hypothetical protein
MTQTDTLTWRQTFQTQLMAALDAAWAMLESTDNPAVIKRIRDKAKAIGDLAAMARKVTLIVPPDRASHDRAKTAAPTMLDTVAAHAAATASVANVSAMLAETRRPEGPEPAPAAQAEQTRRALDKLKGGRRGRL